MIQEFRQLAKGKISPSTQCEVERIVRTWKAWLDTQDPTIRRDRVTIQDFKRWEKALIDDPKKGGSTVRSYEALLRIYYRLLADAYPERRWPRFYAQLIAHKKPLMISSISPHQAYPLQIIPKILEASRQRIGKRKHSKEDYVVTALFLYSGMRAQALGLRVSDLHFDSQTIVTRVKGGHEIYLPMHSKLKQILQDHLETREYESDMLFRSGHYPYTFLSGGSVHDAEKSLQANQCNVKNVMRRVEVELRKMGIEKHLTSHRFRKSIGTYYKRTRWGALNIGLDDREMRLYLGHQAKNVTQSYDMQDASEVARKISLIDLGSEEWIEAHIDVFNGISATPNNGGSLPFEELRAQFKGLTKDERLEILSSLMES